MIPEVTPTELAAELSSAEPPVLLDVRESHELEISRLDVDHHIPLGQLPQRIGELDMHANIVVVCRSGNRSAHATQFLLGRGFESVRNLSTGMNGWAQSVDRTVQVY